MGFLQGRGLVLGDYVHFGGPPEIVDVAPVVRAEAVQLVVGYCEVQPQGLLLQVLGQERLLGEVAQGGVLPELTTQLADVLYAVVDDG